MNVDNLRDALNGLEKVSRKLEPSTTEMEDWNSQVMKMGVEMVDHIDHIPAYYGIHHKNKESDYLDWQNGNSGIATALEIFKRTIGESGINAASGGHFGYIPGGGVYPSALADYLVDVFNPYAAFYYANEGCVTLENAMIKWMAGLVGYPDTFAGNLSSGGSVANLIAMTTARDSQGLVPNNIEKSVIYFTSQTHHSIHKALRICGLSHAIWRHIEVDAAFRMSADHLRETIEQDISAGLKPSIVIASIGTTDTGAVDPIDTIADICEDHDCWLHIDAAYGGFFILVDELKVKFKGVHRSDSITMDPHKTLFLPYGTGAVLVRNGKTIKDSHYYRAAYLYDAFHEEVQPSPADLSPELTKHFRGLRFWLPLQILGLEPFKVALKEKWLLCQYFYCKIQELGFEVGPQPELSVCIYRYETGDDRANSFNEDLMNAVKEDGRIFVSPTTINGVFWLRAAIVSFRTHIQHIDQLLDILNTKKEEFLAQERV